MAALFKRITGVVITPIDTSLTAAGEGLYIHLHAHSHTSTCAHTLSQTTERERHRIGLRYFFYSNYNVYIMCVENVDKILDLFRLFIFCSENISEVIPRM